MRRVKKHERNEIGEKRKTEWNIGKQPESKWSNNFKWKIIKLKSTITKDEVEEVECKTGKVLANAMLKMIRGDKNKQEHN